MACSIARGPDARESAKVYGRRPGALRAGAAAYHFRSDDSTLPVAMAVLHHASFGLVSFASMMCVHGGVQMRERPVILCPDKLLVDLGTSESVR